MGETEEDRAYYQAAEAAFIRRRGTPFLLSPRDFALLKEWRALGIPVEVVEAGVDEAFSRREERGAAGRVNSLAYCRDAVLEAWERRAETARGRGREGGVPEPDAHAALAALGRGLEDCRGRRPELAAPLDAALRSVRRLEKSGRSAEEVEASLARLDRRLAGELYEVLPAAERGAVDLEIDHLLAGAGARMDASAAEKTRRALRRRAVRERLALPRLSLL
jgi:hypothetical protein